MKIHSLFTFVFLIFYQQDSIYGLTTKQVSYYREMAKRMFYHAYDGYMKYAFPYDELRPITCDGHDTWGSYSLTLIDALDTLAIMGNKTEFRKVAQMVLDRANFDSDINVSVFETNIRIVGGLVSAHLMARRMDMELESGWPCSGPLLRLAETVARKLLPAFHTKTGMPYGTVNLAHGVPYGETPITCTAGVGTYLVEFGALSRLTGDSVFEKSAVRAMLAAWRQRSSLDLLGNHIDVTTGRWTALDAGIGAGVDSYFEYLVKGAALLQRPELMQIFNSARVAIDQHLRQDDWHLWVTMTKGHVTMPVFQSLEAFWPGVLVLAGDVESAQKTLFNYHQVWRQYGFTPESYNIPQSEAGTKREGYPLRPELIESLMYMFRATGDRVFLSMGADIITSIEHSTKTPCGYATVKNVRNHQLENRMESFFLAETTKYLYLLFAEDHWIHNNGGSGKLWRHGRRTCVLDAGGYIFNSEAHPMDPGALACCSLSPAEQEGHWMGLSPQHLAEVILKPNDPLRSLVPPATTATRTPAVGAATTAHHGTVTLNDEEEIDNNNNDDDDDDAVEMIETEETSPDASIPDNGFQANGMPSYFEEEVDIETVKRKLDEAVNENYRKNRYQTNDRVAEKIKLRNAEYETEKLSKKSQEDESSDKVDGQVKFDATYEGSESPSDDDGLDKIITSAKSQLSQDSKELEPDSNLTSLDELSGQNSSGSEGGHLESSVTLNLPRFGAIITSGENTSAGSATSETAGISTSVSSSKYSATPRGLVGSKIVKDLLQPILEKTPRSIVPSGPCLAEQLETDLREYSNFTSRAAYSLLSCPHPPFSTLFSYKGQIITV